MEENEERLASSPKTGDFRKTLFSDPFRPSRTHNKAVRPRVPARCLALSPHDLVLDGFHFKGPQTKTQARESAEIGLRLNGLSSPKQALSGLWRPPTPTPGPSWRAPHFVLGSRASVEVLATCQEPAMKKNGLEKTKTQAPGSICQGPTMCDGLYLCFSLSFCNPLVVMCKKNFF